MSELLHTSCWTLAVANNNCHVMTCWVAAAVSCLLLTSATSEALQQFVKVRGWQSSHDHGAYTHGTVHVDLCSWIAKQVAEQTQLQGCQCRDAPIVDQCEQGRQCLVLPLCHHVVGGACSLGVSEVGF